MFFLFSFLLRLLIKVAVLVPLATIKSQYLLHRPFDNEETDKDKEKEKEKEQEEEEEERETNCFEFPSLS